MHIRIIKKLSHHLSWDKKLIFLKLPKYFYDTDYVEQENEESSLFIISTPTPPEFSCFEKLFNLNHWIFARDKPPQARYTRDGATAWDVPVAILVLQARFSSQCPTTVRLRAAGGDQGTPFPLLPLSSCIAFHNMEHPTELFA